MAILLPISFFPTHKLLYSVSTVLYFCCTQNIEGPVSKNVNGTLFHSTVTCKDLTQPSEVEESTLRHGEQLTQEHQEGD